MALSWRNPAGRRQANARPSAVSERLKPSRISSRLIATFNGHVQFDPAGARALLDKFGYVDRDRDGWRDLPDGPARAKLFRAMSALVTAYAPWMLDVYRYENVVVYPWVVGFKYSGIYQHPWPYLDIDSTKKRVPVQ